MATRLQKPAGPWKEKNLSDSGIEGYTLLRQNDDDDELLLSLLMHFSVKIGQQILWANI